MTEAWKSTAVGWLSHDQRLLLAVLRAVSHAEAIATVTIATEDLLDKPLLKPWTVQGFEGAAEGLERHGHEVAAWALRMLTVKVGDYPAAVTALTAEACHLAGKVKMIWVEVSARCRIWDAIAEGRILVSGIDLFAAVERVRLMETQQLEDAAAEKETKAMYDDIWIADFACAPNAREAAEILVEATVAATGDNTFEAFPTEDRSPGARFTAETWARQLHVENHRLAWAWRAWASDDHPDIERAVCFGLEIVQASTLPGIPRAQAVAHMRVWRKMAKGYGQFGGDIEVDIFAVANMNWRDEMARVEHDDPRAMRAFRPPVSLLTAARWDVAARELRDATLAQLHPNHAVIAAAPDIYGGNQRLARLRIDALVEILFDAGTETAGELAIGWQMMACSPGNPSRLHQVLPQLQRLLDRTFMGGDQRRATEARLIIWWSAAAGNFENGKFSLFHLAAMETDMFSDADYDEDGKRRRPKGFESARKTAVGEDPANEVPSGPSLVVMPKEKSTKLDSSHSVHGAFKKLVDVPLPLVVAHDVQAIRRQLHREYPHAVTAIDLVLRDLREDRPVTLKPFMLVGGPGAGKSRLVRRLGEMLDLYVFRYDGAAASDGGGFGGVSKFWSSSQPSAPVRAIEQAKHANPIVMVDEIDKAASDSSRNGSLGSAMLGFLDPETSTRFRDPSLDAEFDCSRVSYCATANDDTHLPAPLRDRFRIIRVPDPTLAHLPALAANVMRELTAADESRMHDEPLADDELHVIGRAWQRSGLSMRKLQKIVGATLEARDAHSMRH